MILGVRAGPLGLAGVWVCFAAISAAVLRADDKPPTVTNQADGDKSAGQAKPPVVRSGRARPAGPVKAPEVTGAWTGDWGPYNPASGVGPAKEKCKALDCVVEAKDGVWRATFEGECGRPYKYTIKMEGRQVGGSVLFKGTVDLGEQDGGVFDWIGKATDNEFVGFYTSAHYTGVFSLKRAKKN
jgi:hypothetical protein